MNADTRGKIWILAVGRIKFPIIALVGLVAVSLACNAPGPTPGQPATSPTASPTPVPTTVPTAVPTVAPTEPAAQSATLAAPAPTAQPAASELAILSFTIDAVEETAAGKRVALRWQTSGAVRALLASGTSHRFPQMWEAPPNGTLTVDLAETNYRDPTITLIAYDAQENDVSQSLTLEWPCRYDYFFEPEPKACPRYAASFTPAAEQHFEGGRMIWLEEIQGPDFVECGLILVLYADGKYEQYEDTWTSAEPESDPVFAPPSGMHQPVRGFGKLWRENVDLREQLGWAVAPEQGFEAAWQQQTRETLPSVAFVRTFDGQIVHIHGWGWQSGGSWQTILP